MLAATVIAFRFLQYSGAVILFGSSLFFIYGLPRRGACAAVSLRWPRRLLWLGAVLLLVGSCAGLIAQTGLVAGSAAAGFKMTNLRIAATQMNFGRSSVARAAIAVISLLALAAKQPSFRTWIVCAIGGGVACVSFAWMGHGAATEGAGGTIHLLSDIIHSLAAAIWIGALIGLGFLLLPGQRPRGLDHILHKTLHEFSSVGSATVAILVMTGFVNSWFLIGFNRLNDFWIVPYGQVLLAKLLVFAAMLGLASYNRYHLTPALSDALGHGSRLTEALVRLRRSLLLETISAFMVLGLVAWLGTLAPLVAN